MNKKQLAHLFFILNKLTCCISLRRKVIDCITGTEGDSFSSEMVSFIVLTLFFTVSLSWVELTLSGILFDKLFSSELF